VRHAFHSYGKTLNPGSVLAETCRILEEWTSQGFVKRLWSHRDFPGLAEGIDFRINAFRDVFSVSTVIELRLLKLMLNTQASRLIALSQGQDAMDAKLCVVSGYTTCFLIDP
jgi:hypothetical protein